MKNVIEYYVVVVKRPQGVDKYYREREEDANSIANLNKETYPKAKVKVIKEKVRVED